MKIWRLYFIIHLNSNKLWLLESNLKNLCSEIQLTYACQSSEKHFDVTHSTIDSSLSEQAAKFSDRDNLEIHWSSPRWLIIFWLLKDQEVAHQNSLSCPHIVRRFMGEVACSEDRMDVTRDVTVSAVSAMSQLFYGNRTDELLLLVLSSYLVQWFWTAVSRHTCVSRSSLKWVVKLCDEHMKTRTMCITYFLQGICTHLKSAN